MAFLREGKARRGVRRAARRFVGAIQAIAAAHAGETVVVVTHSNAMSQFMTAMLHLEPGVERRMIYFGLLLPGVSLLSMAYLGWNTLKETLRGYKAAKSLGKATNETSARELEEAEQKVAAQQQQEKSEFQFYKIFEVTGESMPQSILQTSIVLKNATGGLAGLWTFLVK